MTETIDIREAMLLLHLSKSHTTHLLATGQIEHTKTGKGRYAISKESVIAWKKASTAAERKRKPPAASPWRFGMIINPARQWRCDSCRIVNQVKINPEQCKNCGKERAK